MVVVVVSVAFYLPYEMDLSVFTVCLLLSGSSSHNTSVFLPLLPNKGDVEYFQTESLGNPRTTLTGIWPVVYSSFRNTESNELQTVEYVFGSKPPKANLQAIGNKLIQDSYVLTVICYRGETIGRIQWERPIISFTDDLSTELKRRLITRDRCDEE